MAQARQYIQDSQINNGTTASSNIKMTDVMPIQHTDVASNVNQINKVNIAQTLCEPVAVCDSNNPANGAYTATCSNFPDFALSYTDSQGTSHNLIGMKVRVVFNYGITYGSVSGGTYPTLNINGSGAIPLLAQGKTMATGACSAGQTVEFTVIPYGNGLAYDADTNVREKTTDYTIYVDGTKRVDSVTSDGTDMVTSRAIYSAIDKVKDIMSSLPTDAVLHYSFDEVPDYPDGNADVRLINNTYDLQGMSQKFNSNGGVTFTNNNGNLQITIATAGSSQGAYISNASIKNKVIKIKIKVLSLTGPFSIQNGLGNTIKSFTSAGTYEMFFVGTDSTANYNNMYIISNYAFDLIVEAMYIGDGSYSTPIIDNANGQNNATNNGGIATKGVSGKGLKCLKNKHVTISDFNFNDNFSISIWVNPESQEQGLSTILKKTDVISLYNGANWAGGYNVMHIDCFTGNEANYTYWGTLLPAEVWTHLAIVKNGTELKIYKNGQLWHTKTLAGVSVNKNDNDLYINYMPNQNMTKNPTYDDLVIFDRALSETEVMALYLNKANTPKYYPPVPLPE